MLPSVLLNQYLFYPDRTIYARPQQIGLAAEDVWLTTADDVRLHGWLVTPRQIIGTLLFLHGNAGNISHRLDNLARLADAGFQVLIIDYRGYGRSEGAPDEAGTYADALAAWRWLELHGHGPHAIFGRSLGGAIAIWLAAQADVTPHALIVENTFTRGRELAAQLLPFGPMAGWLPDFYPSVARIAHVQTPLLIIHGEQDELIPVAHGRRLYAAAVEPKELYLVPNGHHNDTYYWGGAAYWQRLQNMMMRPEARPK